MAFGVILIFMGLILVTASNSSKKYERSALVASTEKGWSVSADFARGDKISLELRPPAKWVEGYFDPEETGPGPTLYILINISNPQGGATQFMIHYYLSDKMRMLLIWKINITQQHEGLDTTLLYNEKAKMYDAMGGITKYAGTYNATVVALYPPRDEAPYIGFFKKYVVTEYPYSSFLPVSAVTVGAGVILLLFGLKKQPSRASRRKKRAHLPSSRKHR